MFLSIALALSAVLPVEPQHGHMDRKLETVVVSKYTFAVTIETIKRAATAEKFGVQGTHELSKILTEKGFPRKNLTVVEVCNPRLASESLDNDVLAGLMMPCPIMVWEEDGKVLVATFNTNVMATMFRGKEMARVGREVDEALRKILESVEK